MSAVTSPSDVQPVLLDTKQAAAYLNVSYDWLKKQVAGRKLPHTRIGTVVRFTQNHLEQIIKAGEVDPAEFRSKPIKSTARSKL